MPNSKLQEIAARYEDDLVCMPAAVRPKALGWHTKESMDLGFRDIARMFPETGPLSVNDLGCAFGNTLDYIGDRLDVYNGYDISEKILEKARQERQGPRIRFFLSDRCLYPADYSIASMLIVWFPDSVTLNEWEIEVGEILQNLSDHSRIAFAFNTYASTHPNKHPGQYYPDVEKWMEYCKRFGSPELHVVRHGELAHHEKDGPSLPRWATVIVRK